MAINFYSNRVEPYGVFSNFAAYGFEADGKFWPTSEHYFQAQKFLDDSYKEQIRQTPSPMTAALMGRDKQHPIRSDWDLSLKMM
jgi:ribA/ribD-fused uncharacterized protein